MAFILSSVTSPSSFNLAIIFAVATNAFSVLPSAFVTSKSSLLILFKLSDKASTIVPTKGSSPFCNLNSIAEVVVPNDLATLGFRKYSKSFLVYPSSLKAVS